MEVFICGPCTFECIISPLVVLLVCIDVHKSETDSQCKKMVKTQSLNFLLTEESV